MTQAADFDLQAAHAYFAAHCFDACWALIDKPTRSVEEAEQLIALGHASLYHWTQRADLTPENLSIAHWLLSRSYAALGDAPMAQRYGGSCLRISVEGGVRPMLIGFAFEALARAALIVRDWQVVEENLKKADEILEQLTDEVEHKRLADDLAFVRDALGAAQNEHS